MKHLLLVRFLPTKYESNPLRNNGKRLTLEYACHPAHLDIAILKDRLKKKKYRPKIQYFHFFQ